MFCIFCNSYSEGHYDRKEVRMDDVEMMVSIMDELVDFIYRPVVEDKYGYVLDELKDFYLRLGAHALALEEEEKFKQALIDLCDFSQQQVTKVLHP